MKREAVADAFVSIIIAEERLLETYFEAMAACQAKQLVLIGPMPFSLRDEIDLNKRIMAYADACISIINTMQKLLGLERLRFPLGHNLLRKFRDQNHHLGYKPFQPYRTHDSANFYIWPVLSSIKAIRDEHPEWCKKACKTTVDELLAENHKYIISLVSSQKQKFHQNGYVVKFNDAYHAGVISFASDVKD